MPTPECKVGEGRVHWPCTSQQVEHKSAAHMASEQELAALQVFRGLGARRKFDPKQQQELNDGLERIPPSMQRVVELLGAIAALHRSMCASHHQTDLTFQNVF